MEESMLFLQNQHISIFIKLNITQHWPSYVLKNSLLPSSIIKLNDLDLVSATFSNVSVMHQFGTHNFTKPTNTNCIDTSDKSKIHFNDSFAILAFSEDKEINNVL